MFASCTTTNYKYIHSYFFFFSQITIVVEASSRPPSRARRKRERKETMSSSSNLETRSIIDELRNFDKSGLFDLGHPLLNRIAESFVKAAGIGAVQAVAREAYLTAVEGADTSGIPPEISAAKRHRFPDLRGETNAKTVEALVKGTGKESLQWGLAAGMYSGLTYGLKEARGVHDWKNSALAGAVTGAALALTSDGHSHEQIVQCAITGAAISTAANLLTGIF
ncbi:outer envelope pore protein 16-2, chloroplastic-like isoform X2 [Coffea arabica]|uniref:Outer envelope pore protein 16-2, chloroplastic-like isoform X2 n=2 Tax=Coffea arabica TaxID=13443 RepID=A0A6P6WTY0_COFAR